MAQRDNVKAALQDTSLEIETVDRALVRRYTQMFRFGQFERPYDPGEIDAAAHGAVSRRIGTQIAVLLKNDGGLLPLDPDAGSIVLIGQSEFVDDACLGGGGTSKVVPLYTVPPLDGMRDVLARPRLAATVTKVTVADDLSNLDEAKERPGGRRRRDHGRSGRHRGRRPAGREPAQRPEPDDGRVLGVNPRTVVVLKDGNPVLMPWIDEAPAVLEAWNQGTRTDTWSPTCCSVS